MLPEDSQEPSAARLPARAAGQTLLEQAAALRLNPWQIALSNQAGAPLDLLPAEPLFLPEQPAADSPSLLQSIQIDTGHPAGALVQGATVVFHVQTLPSTTLTGALEGHLLHFFEETPGSGVWTAFQGIHAMAQPGLNIFSLQVQSAEGRAQTYEQSLLLYPGDFPQDPPLTVDPATIDPAITQPEEDQVFAVVSAATPTRQWSGIFQAPVDTPECTRSRYGSRRSFNGSPYIYFHSGLDYGVCAGPEIYAPAPGVVVFTGQLDVRGSATIIDHGWGVYTGYWHQSEIDVKVGDQVQTGQVIGKIGDTGRVTGEHLHWEVFINGVQVDPETWLARAFP